MELLQTLPSDWHFFAKGNANALFAYDGPNPDFQGRLLRLRLEKPLDLYVSVEKLNDFIQGTCEPLFPGQIVGTQMVEVSPDFRGSLLTKDCKLMIHETHGFLMENVRRGNHKTYKLLKYCTLHVGQSSAVAGKDAKNESQKAERASSAINDFIYGSETNSSRASSNEEVPSPVTSVLLEFKPKWLYEPKEMYCRTCLLKQLKGHPRHFCSLDLIREKTIDRGVGDLVSAVPPEVKKQLEVDHFPIRQLITAFARRRGNLLLKLKEYEAVREEDSILSLNSTDDVLDRLSLAMTLRDVGMFLKMEDVTEYNVRLRERVDGDAFLVHIDERVYEVTAYIYDLDLKSSARFQHWKAVEEQLQPFYNAETDWPLCRQ